MEEVMFDWTKDTFTTWIAYVIDCEALKSTGKWLTGGTQLKMILPVYHSTKLLLRFDAQDSASANLGLGLHFFNKNWVLRGFTENTFQSIAITKQF